MKKNIFAISLIFFLFLALNVNADSVGEKRKFYIESSYDSSRREEISAVLVKITPKIYFYADESWWDFSPQNEIHQSLSELGEEFEKNIYPVLTSDFGPEWNPGIDKDPKITVLIHPMKETAGGYFRSNDEYPKIQISDSNEREMLYLNAEHIRSSLAKSFLAHEFVHLITFNQKDNNYDISEDVWLNETRAEYASTLVGYDDEYKGSNLEKRAQIFSDSPSDCLIKWQGEKEDYGTVNLFAQYLVDHYGKEILIDSLYSPEIGIESINYALEKNGFKKKFSQIFLDWSIAVLINNCNYGSKYCYLNENLRNFRVNARTNFLPLTGKSTLTVVDTTELWTGNWYKIIGGNGDLRLEFISSQGDYFTIPYVTKNKEGHYVLEFLELDDSLRGEINIENFGENINSLYIIPIVNKPDSDNFYSFSWSVSVERKQEDNDLINRLLSQIQKLNEQIAAVQAQINAILSNGAVAGANSASNTCSSCQKINLCAEIENNLYYGLRNNQEVKCLQEFLKSQGTDIYPESLITGNFLSLTEAAVVRFQEKYASDILAPWGLEQGTGYVGKTTREKINQLLY